MLMRGWSSDVCSSDRVDHSIVERRSGDPVFHVIGCKAGVSIYVDHGMISIPWSTFNLVPPRGVLPEYRGFDLSDVAVPMMDFDVVVEADFSEGVIFMKALHFVQAVGFYDHEACNILASIELGKASCRERVCKYV